MFRVKSVEYNDDEILNRISNHKDLGNVEIYKLGRCVMKQYWDYVDNKSCNMGYISRVDVFLKRRFGGCRENIINNFIKTYNNIVQRWPIAGVLIRSTRNRVLLVRNNGSKSWSYPKGKIEHMENSLQCAIRECKEETDVDVSELIDEKKYLCMPVNGKRFSLYIIDNVDEDVMSPHILDVREIIDVKWLPFSSDMATNKKYNVYINRTFRYVDEYFKKQQQVS